MVSVAPGIIFPLTRVRLVFVMFISLKHNYFSSGSLATTIMSSDSNLVLTDEQVVYELSSVFHSGIIDIVGYGIYTSIYFVAVYLICTSSALTWFRSLKWIFSVSTH